MLGVTNGLRELRVHRVVRSSAPLACTCIQDRHFIASAALGDSVPGVAATPEAEAAAVAAKKTGRAAYWFVGVAAAAVIGTLAYPQLVTLPPPTKQAPLPPPLPPTSDHSAPASVSVPTAPESTKLLESPRDKLDNRVATLRAELAELRKQKRNEMIDMKKKAIKDEIAMIQSGIAKLEKA